MKKQPADYVVRDEATIEDIDLDHDERDLLYHWGEKLTEARAAELGEALERELEGRRSEAK